MMWWNNDGFWGSGRSWPGILVIGLGMLACMAMMAMMMRHGMSRNTQNKPDADDAPESILAKRLASGEIDVEEYERRREALHRINSPRGPTPESRSVEGELPTAVSGTSPPEQSKPHG